MITEAPEYFTQFTPHIDRIDFDHPVFDDVPEEPKTDEDFANCQEAADYIAHLMIGLNGREKKEYFKYYREPEFKGMRPLEIELKILREHGRDNFAFPTKYGKLPYIHGLIAIKLMFPETDITPPLADITYLSMGMFSYRRKHLHLLGSMDAGKSSTTARLSWLYSAIDPHKSFVISATPLMEGARLTIFGDIVSLASELNRSCPPDDVENTVANRLWPDMKIASAANRIDLYSKSLGKGGFMQHRALKREGVAIGAKGDGKDKREGIGLFIADEVNKIENIEAFKRDIENVARQEWFQLQTTQNPRDPFDAGGLLITPKPWLGWGPRDFNEIRNFDMTMWPTELSGIAYRLDGMKSVNIVCGKTVYPYLVTKQKVQAVMTDYGEDSPQVWSQVKAMFSGEAIASTLLSEPQVKASRHDENDYTVIKKIGTLLSCDPAETGTKDKAVMMTADMVEATVTYIDGTRDYKSLLVVNKPIEYIVFDDKQVWASDKGPKSYFYNEYIELGLSVKQLTWDAPVSYEQQIALRIMRRAKDEGIPFENIIYDPSMRADITTEIVMMMGNGPVAMPWNKPPKGIQLVSENKNTADICVNGNSECLLLGADAFKSKSVRSNGHLAIPILQMQRRRFALPKGNNEKQPEKKADFKGRNGQKSPDEGDAWCYLCWLARQRGFHIDSIYVAGEGQNRRLSAFQLTQKRNPILGGIPELTS